MPPLGLTPDEQAYVSRLTAIRERSNVTPDLYVAANAVALTRNYPGMTAGIVASLARSGVGPGPQAQAIWNAQLKSQNKNGQPGETRRVSKKKGQRPAKLPTDPAGLLAVAAQYGSYAKTPTNIRDQLTSQLGAVLAPLEDSEVADLARQAGLPEEGGAVATNPYTVMSIRQTARHMRDVAKHGTGDIPGPLQAVGTGLGAFRTGVRQGFVGLQSGYEALQAGARAEIQNRQAGSEGGGLWGQRENAPTVEDVAAQSPSAILEQTTAYQAWVKGKSTGEGFLPSWESPAMESQAKAARKYSPYLIGGHAWTPGRAFGQGVGLEPDTTAFNIASGLFDASVALSKLDPAGYGLAKFANARAATKVFAAPDDVWKAERIGAISAVRKRISKKIPDEWAVGDGAELLKRAGEETDPWSIYHAFGEQVPVVDDYGRPVIAPIADSTNADGAWQALRPHLGTTVQNVPKFKPSARPNKLLDPVPADSIDFSQDALRHGGANQIAVTGDRVLANVRASEEVRRSLFNDAARIGTDRARAYAYKTRLFDAVGDELAKAGWDAPTVKNFLRHELRTNDEATIYAVDRLGQPLAPNEYLQFAGDTTPVGHAVTDAQLLNDSVQMPDFRVVRRATSKLAPVLQNGPVDLATAAADEVMSYWRRIQLTRPAWGVRVVLEEQLRIAAAGGDSMFHHPLSWAMWVIGNPESKLVDRLQRWEEAGQEGGQLARLRGGIAEGLAPAVQSGKAAWGRGFYGGDGKAFTNWGAYNELPMMRFDAVYDEDPRVLLHQYSIVPTSEPGGTEALARELLGLHNAQLARGLLDSTDLTHAQQRFWDGDLSEVRKFMGQNPRFAPLIDPENGELARLASDRQMDLVNEAIRGATAQNPVLADAIRTGKLGDVSLAKWDGSLNDSAVKKLQDLIDEGQTVPTRVRKQDSVVLPRDAKGKRQTQLNHGLDMLFEWSMPKWTDLYSRSPYARQAAWQAWEDLLPYSNQKARHTILANARKTRLAKADIARIEEKVKRLDRIGDDALAAKTPDGADKLLDLESSSRIAMRRSNTATKELLYDLSERSQFFDMARLIFPFGEAWREVLTRWVKLTVENPQIVRRGQQVLMGARSPGSEAVNEATGGIPLVDALGNPTGQGFLYKNQYGEEVYASPFTQMINDKLWGVPIPLTGSVQGLNIIGNGLPGFGPLAELPVKWFLDTIPGGDRLKKTVFPYGEPTGNPLVDLTDAMKPTWYRRLEVAMNNPNATRTYATGVLQTAKYHASTGEFDIHNDDPNIARAELNRMLDQSKHDTTMLYFTMMAGGAALPTAPSPEWVAKDKNGNLTALWRATDWFYKQMDPESEGGKGLSFDKATEKFFDYFGTDNFLLLQPSTAATVPGLSAPASVSGSKWVAKNEDFRKAFPHVYTLFAPDSKDYDSAEARRQFERQEKVPLSPDKAVEAANSRLASFIYHRKVEEFNKDGEIGNVERVRLRELKQELLDDFSGYDPAGTSKMPSTEVLVSEIRRAAEDPAVANTRPGRLVAEYFGYRDQIIQAQLAIDPTSSHTELSTAKKYAPLRAWLADWGQKKAEKTPRFSALWDILSREVEVDDG